MRRVAFACLSIALLLALPGCPGPDPAPPEIHSVRADADGNALTLRATVEPFRWENYRVLLRYGRPVDDWVSGPTVVDLGTDGGDLFYQLPDGDRYRGATLRYQWSVEYASPGETDYETVFGELLDLHIPTFMLLPSLTAAEVDILFANTLVIDGNLQPSTHGNALEADGTAVVDNGSYSSRIQMIREEMGVSVISQTISSELDTLTTFVDFVDGRDDVTRIQTSYDVEAAHRDGTLGIIYYSQKHYPIEGDVSRLTTFYDEGLRIFQIAYGANDAPNQAPDEQLGGGTGDGTLGVTDLGELAIEQMNALGMVVDCSHCNSPTIDGAVALSIYPVLANHGAARALTNVPRNLSDADLQAVARSGGVIGVVTVGPFFEIGADGPDLGDFVAHVNHIVDLVGIDHVGLASDSFINGWPTSSQFYAGSELTSLDRWKTVIRALSEEQDAAGNDRYSIEDLRKIMGWNFLRAYQETMIGHTKPALEEVEIDGNTATFSWEPSRAIGVPEPVYSARIYGATATGDFEEILRVDSSGTQFSRPIEDLLDDDGQPYFKYRWFVRAENDLGFTNSRWGFFFVP